MNEANDSLKLRGRFEMKCIEHGTGKVLYEYVDENLVVNLGRTNMVKLLGGDAAGLVVTKIGVGTGSTAATAADTGLTGAYVKLLNTAGTSNIYTLVSNVAKVTFGYQFDTSEANGMSIQEFGLYNSASVLVARKVLSSAIAKNSSFAVSGTWTLSIT